jgi:hypothetical protein
MDKPRAHRQSTHAGPSTEPLDDLDVRPSAFFFLIAPFMADMLFDP